MANSLSIATDEHVFICGQTGCGKSVLAECYLAGYSNVIKLDTKGEVYERRKKGQEVWRGLVENEDYTVVTHFSEIARCETGKIIYAPVWDENNAEYYELLCADVYNNGETILWIDELMTVTENAQNYPRHLKALYTAGRSRESVVWALTQRPSGIPSICIANSTHYFCFAMGLSDDRKKMMQNTGCIDMMERPEKYYFWYYRQGMGEHGILATLDL